MDASSKAERIASEMQRFDSIPWAYELDVDDRWEDNDPHGLVGLSTNGKQIVASKAGHNIQADEPQLVIDAIVEVVTQSRTNSTTTGK